MSDFNDFGFSTVSADEYAATQTKTVDTAKEVASTATASVKPELDKIESKIASLTDSMRVLSDEMTDRKEELNDKWGTRMNEVEGLILPLLQNLAKDLNAIKETLGNRSKVKVTVTTPHLWNMKGDQLNKINKLLGVMGYGE